MHSALRSSRGLLVKLLEFSSSMAGLRFYGTDVKRVNEKCEGKRRKTRVKS